MALDSISSISVSKFTDNIMVIHSKDQGHDLVVSVGGEDENHGTDTFFFHASYIDYFDSSFISCQPNNLSNYSLRTCCSSLFGLPGRQ